MLIGPMARDDNYVLTSVTLPADFGPNPEPMAVVAHLGLGPRDFDKSFGVVPVSPDKCLFAMRVRRAVVAARPGMTAFSDPQITPLGLPDPGKT